jgi:hypothetical protein
MIHRQEKRSLFGFAVSRHIDQEGAQTIIAAIMDTPDDMPVDLVLHTPGGLMPAAMQIARAVEAHKAKVTVYVPRNAICQPENASRFVPPEPPLQNEKGIGSLCGIVPYQCIRPERRRRICANVVTMPQPFVGKSSGVSS